MLVESKISGNLGVLFINNPPMNTLSVDVFHELASEFEKMQKNEAVKVIVFTGKGIAFSVGADVKFIFELAQSGAREKAEELIWSLHKFFLEVENSEKPTIAAINGLCFGGGLELALACQYIIATQSAQFAFPEIKLGIFPGLGGTQRLPRRIGTEHAARLILGGQSVASYIAFSDGLVDALLQSDFIGGVKLFVESVLSGKAEKKNPPISSLRDVIFTKSYVANIAKGRSKNTTELALRAIEEGVGAPSMEDALKTELKYFLDALFSEDAKEGIGSFLEKRAPNFSEVFGEEPKKETKKEVSSAQAPSVTLATIPPWESDECLMLREAVRDFARGEIEPLVQRMEREEIIPRELIEKMADIGLFGVAFSEECGGAGLGKVGACIVADEITYVHPSTAVFIGAHVELACEALYLFGNKDQKDRYLTPALKGKLLGALATTEPDVGSDVGAMKTSAKKVDGGWVLNGTKQFISNAENADFIIVFAQTDPLGGNKTLVSLIVETKSKGFSILKREKKIGIRASNTNSFALDSVFVPDANLLGESGRGFKMVMEVFNSSRITIGAASIGFIRRAYDEAVSFAKNRMLFGEPMWMKQNTQLKLAEMEATRFMVESMVFHAAWLADRGTDIRTIAAAVKYFGPELAGKVVDMSLQLHGGAGFIEDSPIAMFYRDARIFRLFEGTSEVQLLTIAKELVKKEFL